MPTPFIWNNPRRLQYEKRVTDEYRFCRDSTYGFGNPHLNEKAFSLAAARFAENMDRILRKDEEPILEDERLKPLI